MRRARAQVDPVSRRRVSGGIAIALGLSGLYQAYQSSQGLDDTTYVPLLYAASVLVAAAGILAIVRPVRAAGWLVNVMVVVLVLAVATLSYLPPHTGY